MTKDLIINLDSYEQTLICVLALYILQCLQIPSKVMGSHNRIFVTVTQKFADKKLPRLLLPAVKSSHKYVGVL